MISTALHHVSVVQVPEPVENVAIGSTAVHVEWHGDDVLIEPLKAGVDTNMVVFTRRTTYLYEIAAAAEPGSMSWIVKEKGPAPPPQPVQPSPVEVQRLRDKQYTSLLLTTHNIDSSAVRNVKHAVNFRILQVSSDAQNLYIRMRATNNTKHTYRLQNPLVLKIDPAFGADMAYKNIYRQIPAEAFRAFRAYKQIPVELHGSTIDMVDMPADATTEWVIAVRKPEVQPSIFTFTFHADRGGPIYVAGIF